MLIMKSLSFLNLKMQGQPVGTLF